MRKLLIWLGGSALIAISLVLLWRQFQPARPIPVGMVAWMNSGAVVGSSEMHAGDLFLEEHPRSRVRILPVDEEWQPERSVSIIREAMGKGVRFFVSTHPSKCAVASAHLFADSRALIINTAATSPALTGKDDYMLRIIPDAVQEQRVMARHVARLTGNRILVLQDTGNLPYTDPAFAAFSTELGAQGRWKIVHRKLAVASFKPDEYRPLMAEPYDILYILAGTFQSSIGNIAQLFHYLHPEATILLTPWARSPAILETASESIDRITLASVYPSRHDDRAIDDYFRRFNARFGYQPHSMTIGVRQALELLNQAFAKGYDTPEGVKRYLLSTPTHRTSLGPVSFDRFGDVAGKYTFIQNLRRELK